MAADDKEKQQAGGEEKKKKPMLLFIIIGVVVLLLVGAGAYFFLFSGQSDQEIAKEIAEEQKGQQASPKKPLPEVGFMYALDPFVVNLADPKARHFVKATIILELANSDLKDACDKYLPKIRNDIILLLSSQTLEDVITMEGKIRLRDEIMARVTRILGKDTILNVYFSQFVVQ